MRNKIFIVLILFGISLFALVPLFHAGYFTMHDDEQIARLSQMYLALSQGQIPPRWIPDLGFGFGYPLFNFYPPLVYYLGSVFHFVGFSFITSTKIVFGLGFILAAITMFVWVRKHYGTIPGIFAAILYTYAPYHSVDIYVRGALSEFFSWIFIPLILWAIDMLFEKQQKKYVFFLALSFAALMLSHTLVMLQFGPILLLYLGFLFLSKKNRNFRIWFYLALGLGLGLGLTAYFWLPSILEKQYTLVDAILTKELASYAIHFVCPIQLWSGIWGYGGSIAGCLDGLSFQIGKIQVIMGIGGFLLSIFYVSKKQYVASLSSSVLFLCSIFFTLSYSKFLWDIAKPFWYIQFPWRYLLFAAVFSAFLGGFVIFVIQSKFGKIIAACVVIVLSLLAVIQVRNYFKPQAYRLVTDKDMTSKQDISWRVSNMSYEYVPSTVPIKLSPQKTTMVDFNSKDIPLRSVSYLGYNLSVKELENISYLKRYSVNVYNYKTGVLQINTFEFPGWKIYVDGKETKSTMPGGFLLGADLPAGKHIVEVRFTDTPVRSTANALSLMSIVIFLGAVVKSLKKKK